MNENSLQRHLTPDQLVDVLDGAPVDAAVKQHLNACRACAGELSRLEETLSQIGLGQEDDLPQLGEGYWQDFDARLQGKLGKAGTARRGVSRYWYVAVAATLAFVSWQIMNTVGPEPTEPAAVEAILPAADEDAEFLFLVSVVQMLESTEELEETLELSLDSNFDPSQLTAEEAERFRRVLEEELGDEDAKS